MFAHATTLAATTDTRTKHPHDNLSLLIQMCLLILLARIGFTRRPCHEVICKPHLHLCVCICNASNLWYIAHYIPSGNINNAGPNHGGQNNAQWKPVTNCFHKQLFHYDILARWLSHLLHDVLLKQWCQYSIAVHTVFWTSKPNLHKGRVHQK